MMSIALSTYYPWESMESISRRIWKFKRPLRSPSFNSHEIEKSLLWNNVQRIMEGTLPPNHSHKKESLYKLRKERFRRRYSLKLDIPKWYIQDCPSHVSSRYSKVKTHCLDGRSLKKINENFIKCLNLQVNLLSTKTTKIWKMLSLGQGE